MQNLSNAVVAVLAKDDAARECENRLVFLVCRELGFNLTLEQVELLESLPKFSSIIRLKARVQSKGRFLPSPEVRKQRRTHKQS